MSAVDDHLLHRHRIPEHSASLADHLRGRYGVVLIRDHYYHSPDGRECTGVYGRVEVVAARNALGFEVSNRDSNWLVVVRGDDETIVLPGCAVLAFNYSDSVPHDSRGYYVAR